MWYLQRLGEFWCAWQPHPDWEEALQQVYRLAQRIKVKRMEVKPPRMRFLRESERSGGPVMLYNGYLKPLKEAPPQDICVVIRYDYGLEEWRIEAVNKDGQSARLGRLDNRGRCHWDRSCRLFEQTEDLLFRLRKAVK